MPSPWSLVTESSMERGVPLFTKRFALWHTTCRRSHTSPEYEHTYALVVVTDESESLITIGPNPQPPGTRVTWEVPKIATQRVPCCRPYTTAGPVFIEPMAHPLVWPRKSQFFPIGNTPAVSFIRDQDRGQPLDALLLGCGDPRSILHTVYDDNLGGSPRPLNFTCCDAEPAILARNVLLFTLITDDDKIETLAQSWNIFYHFYLDKSSHALLVKHCRRLLDLSSDLVTWKSSKYASFLQFCTANTLSAIRRYWVLYVELENLPQQEKDILYKSFAAGMALAGQRYDETPTISQTHTPLWIDILKLGPQQVKRYWTTGVTLANPIEISAATILNPSFLYTTAGTRFSVHSGSDPIASFHWSSARNPIMAASKNAPATVADLVNTAKSQFFAWCNAFRKKLTDRDLPIVVIKFFTGDALAFAQTLRLHKERNTTQAGLFTSPWGSSLIELDSDVYPLSPQGREATRSDFNAIDTSNLVDTLGLLNILIATIPLLRNDPSAILHTNSQVTSDGLNGVIDEVCGDIGTISLLLGVAPSSYLSKVAETPDANEIAGIGIHTGQVDEPLAWRQLAFADPTPSSSTPLLPLCIDATSLARIMFSVYKKMFADEKASDLFRRSILKTVERMSIIHNTRATYAAFLRLTKSRVVTDWSRMMQQLFVLIETDTTLMLGLNNYQDLCYHIHMNDVEPIPELLPSAGKEHQGRGTFHDWDDIPPLVCLIMRVPRASLKTVEAMDVDLVGSPILHAEFRGSTSHNIFSNIRPVFGSISLQTDPPHTAELKEDPDAWNGTSDLIVSFYIPAWLLNYDPANARVQLSFRATPACRRDLAPVIGSNLVLFSAAVGDKEHVHIVRERPGNPGELRYCHSPNPIPTIGADSITVLLDEHMRAATFIAKVLVTDEEAKDALANGVVVGVKQRSPCRLVVAIGGYRQDVIFPLPIAGQHPKIHVSRTSFSVDIEVAIIRPKFYDGGYDPSSAYPSPIITSPKPIQSLHSANRHHQHQSMNVRYQYVSSAPPSPTIPLSPISPLILGRRPFHSVLKSPIPQSLLSILPLDLHRLPILVSTSERLRWLESYIPTLLTAPDHPSPRHGSTSGVQTEDVTSKVKAHIADMILMSIGLPRSGSLGGENLNDKNTPAGRNKPTRVFVLATTPPPSSPSATSSLSSLSPPSATTTTPHQAVVPIYHTFVFVNNIRMDNTELVLDACVICAPDVSERAVREVLAAQRTTTANAHDPNAPNIPTCPRVQLINTSNQECAAWKKLLPAFMERSLGGREHARNCIYRRSTTASSAASTQNGVTGRARSSSSSNLIPTSNGQPPSNGATGGEVPGTNTPLTGDSLCACARGRDLGSSFFSSSSFTSPASVHPSRSYFFGDSGSQNVDNSGAGSFAALAGKVSRVAMGIEFAEDYLERIGALSNADPKYDVGDATNELNDRGSGERGRRASAGQTDVKSIKGSGLVRLRSKRDGGGQGSRSRSRGPATNLTGVQDNDTRSRSNSLGDSPILGGVTTKTNTISAKIPNSTTSPLHITIKATREGRNAVPSSSATLASNESGSSQSNSTTTTPNTSPPSTSMNHHPIAPTEADSPSPSCARCGKSQPCITCPICHNVSYCASVCQILDFRVHNNVCERRGSSGSVGLGTLRMGLAGGVGVAG